MTAQQIWEDVISSKKELIKEHRRAIYRLQCSIDEAKEALLTMKLIAADKKESQ